MEIEVINSRRVSHLSAEKIRIKDGSKVITIDLFAGECIVSASDSSDSSKTLILQPIHTNKIKIF